jgi:hypothetical protein
MDDTPRIITRPFRRKRGYTECRVYQERCQDGQKYGYREGFDIRLAVLVFDAVCSLTGNVTFENAVFAIKILRDAPAEIQT